MASFFIFYIIVYYVYKVFPFQVIALDPVLTAEAMAPNADRARHSTGG